MVGFEPTERVTAQTISSRSRYDHFDTSPLIPCEKSHCIYYITSVLKLQAEIF